jgi:mono/diheme cytochrome c family protein
MDAYDVSMRLAPALLFVCMSANAQDISRGQMLYETHCVVCHREGLHERRNSKVATYADLRYQVERWTQQTGRSFTPAEREDLIEFLDATHYRLDLNPRPDKKF